MLNFFAFPSSNLPGSTIYCREKLSDSPSPRLTTTATEDVLWEVLESSDNTTLTNQSKCSDLEEDSLLVNNNFHQAPLATKPDPDRSEDEKWEQTFETVKAVLEDPFCQRYQKRRIAHVASKRRRLAGESKAERLNRLQREAEAKRRRRLNETPEKRQRRLALHAERMRKARRMNKEGTGTVVRQYINNTYTTYTQPDPDEPTQIAYQPTERLQLVSMPHHQQYHTQPVSQGYRTNNQQPTVITVPLPQQTMGNGPVTIHVTLPENLQPGQQQVLQLPHQLLIPTQAGQSNQFVLSQDQFNNSQPMHVIRIQTQPSQPAQSSSHIIIQGQQAPSTTTRSLIAPSTISTPSTSAQAERVVPPRFKNLTDEQIARRRKANAERSRRRRAMETPEQRAERNRRTAERMRQRRAKIAEQRVPPPPPKVKTLSADRFEEIYRSVIGQACDDSKDGVKDEEDKEEPEESTEGHNTKPSNPPIKEPENTETQEGYNPYQTSTTNCSESGHIGHNQQPLNSEVSQT